jgi:hypothetical protein
MKWSIRTMYGSLGSTPDGRPVGREEHHLVHSHLSKYLDGLVFNVAQANALERGEPHVRR